MRNIPIYDVTVGDMNCISLVERPAIETDVLLFAEQETLHFSMNEEKHLAFGPAMIADLPIYRIGPNNEEFYIVFGAEAIQQLVTSFMSNKERTISKAHNGEKLDGVTIIESFIKRDGIQPKGFENIKDGSWFVTMKIENEKIWQELKEGKLNGFSIECTADVIEREETIDDIINNIFK